MLNFGFSLGKGTQVSTALAQALINYANDLGVFQYSTDISGNTTLVNQGTGDDGLLNTGRAIELVNGVNDVTISGDYITWFDFADKQFHSATTSKTFTGVTTNAILTHKTAFDAQSLANLNANPQLIAELGINGSSTELNVTLDATDAFYACSEESGGSLIDQRSVGVENVVNGDFDTDLSGWTNTYWQWVGGRAYHPYSALANAMYQTVLEPNKKYLVSFYVEIVSGSLQVVSSHTGVLFTGDKIFTTSGWYHLIADNTTTSARTISFFRKTAGEFYLDSISAKEATTQDITNYAETVRTNVNQNTAGLQTTCMEIDGAGVPISYDLTKLYLYSDGFIDTQWTWTTGNTITRDTVEYATTTKIMPYQIDDLSADGTTAITTITDFKVEE